VEKGKEDEERPIYLLFFIATCGFYVVTGRQRMPLVMAGITRSATRNEEATVGRKAEAEVDWGLEEKAG
jgi:hypothetical protein